MKRLILHSASRLNDTDISKYEKELSDKIGMSVIILDGKFTDEVYVIED